MFQHIPGCSHKKHVLIWSSKVIFSHSESLISGVSLEWNQRFLQRSRFFFSKIANKNWHLWWVSHCLCWVSENFDISHLGGRQIRPKWTASIFKLHKMLKLLLMVQKSGKHQLIWRISHYLQGFMYVRWWSSSINMWIDRSPKTFFSRTTWILRCFFFDFLGTSS